jgi:medium-chain acyl-[acyl-carrier-protein] hydrolase
MPLIKTLAEALRPQLDRPFAFFGHSLGALVAFELARRLERDGGPVPVRLLVSGCAAPQVPRDGRPLHVLPEAEFRSELRGLNGTPAAVLENEELMELLLPTLRADFALCETYTFIPGPPLTCPINAWGGLNDDAVSRQSLDAWQEQTTGSFRLHLLPGDHFFLHTSRPKLLQMVAEDLRGTVAGATPGRQVGRPTREFTAKPPAPDGGHLHVQRVRPDRPPGCRTGRRRPLTPDEVEGARRSSFSWNRDRFVVCRTALRPLRGEEGP